MRERVMQINLCMHNTIALITHTLRILPPVLCNVHINDTPCGGNIIRLVLSTNCCAQN